METKAKQVERALIATVGRTEDPILVGIVEHEPELVLLLASQETLGTVARVQEEFPEIEFRTLILGDAESLTESFRRAREAYRWAKERGARTLVADITGGTKPMTAGATLALSGMGVVFSYVGGSKRDPETGRVQSGQERIRVLEDPTERYHEADWRAFKANWNAWRMDAAAAVLDRILRLPLLGPAERRFYRHLTEVVRGLAAWDRFHHREALEQIERGLPVALAIAEAWRHGNKARVLRSLEGELPCLKRLVEKTGKPTFGLLADLLANAERRAEAGRYDDAVARLYRAVELAVEADLYTRTGIVLRDPDTWPPELGSDLRERGHHAGLKAVVDLIFDIDLRLGNEGTLAQRIRGGWGQIEPFLERRHRSILAHGTTPVNEEDYRSFRGLFENWGVRSAAPWPRW